MSFHIWGSLGFVVKLSTHCLRVAVAFLTLSTQCEPSGSRFGNQTRDQGLLCVTHGAQYQEQ